MPKNLFENIDYAVQVLKTIEFAASNEAGGWGTSEWRAKVDHLVSIYCAHEIANAAALSAPA